MSKVAVVYWSGTGNTETMANAVAEGAKGAGAEVDVLVANDFNSGKVAEYDGIAFGCPAMGWMYFSVSSGLVHRRWRRKTMQAK